MRSTKSHRHSETLRRTHCNICSPLPWCFYQSQCQQISCSNYKRTFGMCILRNLCVVTNFTSCIRVLHQETEKFLIKAITCNMSSIYFNNLYAQRLCASLHNCFGLRMQVFFNEKDGIITCLRCSTCNSHGLSCCRAFIQHRSIR